MNLPSHEAHSAFRAKRNKKPHVGILYSIFCIPGVISAVLLVLFSLTVGRGQPQQVSIGRFRYQRAIVPGGAGANRLEIDITLLAAAGPFREFSRAALEGQPEPAVIAKDGLSDLRIYDASHREIPYLLVASPALVPRWSEGRLMPIDAARKNSGFEADFGQFLRINGLRLTGIPAPFLKRIRLEGSGDRNRWTVLIEDGTIFDLPAEKLKRLELDFDPGEYRYLRITSDDSASARVPLPGSASARLVSAGSLPPALRAPLRFAPRASEPGVSRYRLRLPAANLPIASIELTSAGGNVLRQARVTEGRMVDYEMTPELLGLASLWHRIGGTTTASMLRIPITAPRDAELELTIKNGDDPPLDLTGISATFAYLPWIYFESPGKEPLMARFGDPGLAAPQYDLASARAAASGLRAAEARWGELQEHQPAVESPASESALVAGALLDVRAFHYARKIPGGKAGLNALLLDAEVLAHTRMSDLRIAGTDGRQIPYLIEKQDEPRILHLPPLEKAQGPATRAGGTQPSGSLSYYRLQLPFANLPASRLALTTSARVFRRDVGIVIEKNSANEREEPWTRRVASAAWMHAEPDTPAAPLMLQLPSLETADAMVVVEEGDNSPLPLESPSLLLPSYRMRFFRKTGEDLTLYYGHSSLEAPRYDLALLATHLIGAAAEEISFGSGSSSEDRQASAYTTPTIVFWAILGVAVVVLFALIARLIKKGADAS
jgi:hypothetical protein